MGIRVTCPNGHSLNIKAFLAGKVGVCPKCEARFRIPRDAPANQRRHAMAGGGSSGDAPDPFPPSSIDFDEALGELLGDPMSPVPAEKPSPANLATPADHPRAGASPGKKAARETARVEKARAEKQDVGGSTKVPVATPAASETAVWFVKPPTGGQYGPATESMVRKWIDESRVTPDSLIWREGWENWRRAAQVFPELASPDRAAPKDLGGFPIEKPAPGESFRRKPKRKSNGVWIVGSLAVLSLILIGALVVVLA